MWTVFRVENEHCTNVGRFRASRDVPLPYKLKKTAEARAEEGSVLASVHEDDEDNDEEDDAKVEERRRQGISVSPTLSRTTGREELERIRTQDTTSTRRRHRHYPSPRIGVLKRVGSILHTAHAQDFERKKRPTGVEDKDGKDRESSDDEEGTGSEAEDEEEEEVEERVVEGEGGVDRGNGEEEGVV